MLVECIKATGIVSEGEIYRVIDSEEGLLQISAGWFEKKDFVEVRA